MPIIQATDTASAESNERRPAYQRDRTTRSASDWRPFLRALAEELDSVAGAAGRNMLLHGVGRQMALHHPLAPQASTAALALEMNEVLEDIGWGQVNIAFVAAEVCLILSHRGLPRVGGRGEPAGTWFAGVLEGLYEGWLAQQPGADSSLVARRLPTTEPDIVVIRYGKG